MAEHRDVDLGHGVTTASFSWRQHDYAGFLYAHAGTDGKSCAGSVMFDLPGVAQACPGTRLWTVRQWDPLTLHPEIICPTCGFGGWVRDGRWVPV